jgi:hypothetical protein
MSERISKGRGNRMRWRKGRGGGVGGGVGGGGGGGGEGGGKARSEAGLDSLFVDDILFNTIVWVKEGRERELGERGSEGEQAGGARWTGGVRVKGEVGKGLSVAHGRRNVKGPGGRAVAML